MKILTAIVTYNRKTLLERCINSVLDQKRKPEFLIVINNGSTDGTEQMLHERGVCFISQANLGAAGGWHRALEYALEHHFEAVWLMDDDGYPATNALACLENSLTPGVACASSVVVREDLPEFFVFPFPVLNGSGLPVIWGWPRKWRSQSSLNAVSPNGIYPYAHFFNGALVSMDAARQVGNIDRDFFIFGEEVDYFYRLRRAGLVISVLDSLHYHPDVSQRPYTPAKVYYYVKNTLILNQRYLNYPWLRHILTLMAALGRTWHRNGYRAALSLVAGADAKSFYSAILRGLQGRVGKDFHG